MAEQTAGLEGIQASDYVAIYEDDVLVAVGKCRVVFSRRVSIGCGNGSYGGHYLIKTGIKLGGSAKAVLIDDCDVDRLKSEIAERKERQLQEQHEQRARETKAQYDALPESVKLASSLQCLCDCESESKIAEAPIEHLRGIIDWAKEQGLLKQ